MDETDDLNDLEALREQAQVEKIYREAVDTLITIVLAYFAEPEPGDEDMIEQLTHDFPGSTPAFWLGLIQMTAEALSDDGLIPSPDADAN